MISYIDLRSDTVTLPTPAMRSAMIDCPVGDDVYGDDPTMNLLEQRAAEILGKEAALFVCSGTMGNQLGIMAQTKRGDEIILSAHAHIFEHEVGAAAVLSGVNQRQLFFENGIYDAKAIEKAIRTQDIHYPDTTLICLENALSNGRVVPLDVMRDVYAIGQKHGINVHMDGARIFNAATALNVTVTELTKYCDTISCCLSKGLCAPVGSIFAGPKDIVDRARKYRKMLGGGMRQAGLLAAAGLLAITKMPKRLHIDHENARYMAQKLSQIPGIHVDLDAVQINLVFFSAAYDHGVLDAVAGKMLDKNIKINGHEDGIFRFVTHEGITRGDIDKALTSFAESLV